MKTFQSLGISDLLTNSLMGQGITEPTKIQEEAIPLLIDGKDLIAQSQTGTGKTFAFVLPILEKIDPENPNIQALIVTPTRELALQITTELQKMANVLNGVNILAVYGGQDVESQLKKLKKNIHIVIGTPGRLLDHIRRKTIDLSKASFLVLDEADQMLHIGFLDEVEEIIKQTPKTRQTLLFSATMPDEIRKLAKRHMVKPENIQIEKTQAPLANIKQVAISTTDRAKQNDLIESLKMHQPFLGVIFCRTKRRVSKLNDVLKANHFNCDELHGDLSQAKREQVMKKFREARIQYLIATDVAARGLDVDGVTHVFNYDMPLDTESYIHRIGRTGRAGSEGLAITFYTPKDKTLLQSIEADLDTRIDKKNLGNARKSDETDKRDVNLDNGRDGIQVKNARIKRSGSRRKGDKVTGSAERDHRGEKVVKGRPSRDSRRKQEGTNRSITRNENRQEHPRSDSRKKGNSSSGKTVKAGGRDRSPAVSQEDRQQNGLNKMRGANNRRSK